MSNEKALPLHEIINTVFFQAKSSIEDRLAGKVSNNHLAVPYIRSKPGAGKTEMLNQLAVKHNWGIETVHLPTLTIEELTGLPQFVEGKDRNGDQFTGTEWSKPDVITRLELAAAKYSGVILFLDDYHLAGPDHQKYCFQLFTDYELKGYKLPKNCFIVLAGNDSSKAGAKTSLSAITNRAAFFPAYADPEAWIRWAGSNDVEPTVVSFLSSDSHQKHFHGDENNVEPWPSPRSWTKLSNALKILRDQYGQAINNRMDLVSTLVSGHVGSEAALEFQQFWTVFSTVNVAEVLDHGKVTISSKEGQDYSKLYIKSMAVTYGYIDRWRKLYKAEKNEKDSKKKKDLEKRLGELVKTYSKFVANVQKEKTDIAIVILKVIADRGLQASQEEDSKMAHMFLLVYDEMKSANGPLFAQFKELVQNLKTQK